MSQTGNKKLEKSYSKREGCNERRERKQVVGGAASVQFFAAGELQFSCSPGEQHSLHVLDSSS